MTPEFRSRRAALVRPNRLLLGLATATALLAVVVGLTGVLSALWTVLGMLSFALFTLALRRRWPGFEYGLYEATAEALTRNGRVVVRRADVTHGLSSRVGDACVVRLNRRWPRRPVDLAVWDEHEGRKLLVALGLDVTQTTADLPGASGFHVVPPGIRRVIVAAALGTWFLVGGIDPTGGARLLALFLGFAAYFAASAIPSRIRVGVDGVHFRWLWMSQFTHFSEVAAVRLAADGKTQFADLVLRAGGTRSIPVSDGAVDDTSLTFSRIVQAYDEYDAGTGSNATEALARGERTAEEWLIALRRLAAGADAGLRTAHVPLERLWRIASDPSAPAAARAGAAVSLSSRADAADRDRLRVIAASVAEPRLRVAIQRAAAEAATDEELREALAEVDADPAKQVAHLPPRP